jgi:hypothetical protein
MIADAATELLFETMPATIEGPAQNGELSDLLPQGDVSVPTPPRISTLINVEEVLR